MSYKKSIAMAINGSFCSLLAHNAAKPASNCVTLNTAVNAIMTAGYWKDARDPAEGVPERICRVTFARSLAGSCLES